MIPPKATHASQSADLALSAAFKADLSASLRHFSGLADGAGNYAVIITERAQLNVAEHLYGDIKLASTSLDHKELGTLHTLRMAGFCKAGGYPYDPSTVPP